MPIGRQYVNNYKYEDDCLIIVTINTMEISSWQYIKRYQIDSLIANNRIESQGRRKRHQCDTKSGTFNVITIFA